MRPDWLPSSTVHVGLHVYETTRVRHVLYPEEARATVDVAGSGGQVTVFAERAELVRVRDALAAVVAELDAARAACGLDVDRAESAA